MREPGRYRAHGIYNDILPILRKPIGQCTCYLFWKVVLSFNTSKPGIVWYYWIRQVRLRSSTDVTWPQATGNISEQSCSARARAYMGETHCVERPVERTWSGSFGQKCPWIKISLYIDTDTEHGSWSCQKMLFNINPSIFGSWKNNSTKKAKNERNTLKKSPQTFSIRGKLYKAKDVDGYG